MTVSLRTRFFLITWPLVVAAVGVVALTFQRWAGIELTRIEQSGESEAVGALAEGVAARWGEIRGASGVLALRELLGEVGPGMEGVVVDPDGRILVTSDSLLQSGREGVSSNGSMDFVRLVREGPLVREEALALTGAPIQTDPGGSVGWAFLVPSRPVAPAPTTGEEIRRGLRRTLWLTFLSASGAAALAALVLAGPLVRQVRRLSEAAAEVQRGALGTRVPEGRDDELGRLERSFNAMAAALERGEIHKRNVVSDVAHELRTPLTNVRGLLEAIEDGLREPDAGTMGALKEQAAVLEALVDELQELSLAESGQLPLDLEPLDMSEEVQAVLRGLEPLPAGVTVEPPGDTALARGDRRRVRQVLANLVRNALTHTPEGGRIRIGLSELEQEVLIEVADDGVGIPEEHLDLIWERFHRVDPSRQRASGGMGLGLAVVRQLVTAMGGSVAVRSTVGVGSTFQVRLPRPSHQEIRSP